MKKILSITAIVFISGLFIFASSYKIQNVIPLKSTHFPASIDFAGENTPLNVTDVKERFDRELLVNANLDASTLLIIKRANRAFPIIEPILKKNNIPDDFKYLAVIESGLVNAVSPAGAKGVWQFMPETAKEKGLEVNDIVDERYHLEKSTEAACSYFLSAKAQIEIQKVTSYYDLLLNDETSRYVFRILALKEIMKNPKLYGFELTNIELYKNIPTRKLEIDSSIIDLASFAIAQGINYKILKIHNPWLRDKKLLNLTKKKYVLEIPTEGY